MIQIEGLWWPDTVGDTWQHALKHVQSADWAIAHCRQPPRRVVQAGGNIGLWPKRYAESFAHVATFEPAAEAWDCLRRNIPEGGHVEAFPFALGLASGRCGIKPRGLGGHYVTAGADIRVVTLDAFAFTEVDLIQLDVEGSELQALYGAVQTIARWHPLIQVELRESRLQQYGATAASVRRFLSDFGYREVSSQQGSDFVFEVQ